MFIIHIQYQSSQKRFKQRMIFIRIHILIQNYFSYVPPYKYPGFITNNVSPSDRRIFLIEKRDKFRIDITRIFP